MSKHFVDSLPYDPTKYSYTRTSKHFVDGTPLSLLDYHDSQSENRISLTLDYLTRDDTTTSIFFEAQFVPGSNLRFKEAELEISLSRYPAEVSDITLVKIQPGEAHSDPLEIAHTERVIMGGKIEVCAVTKENQDSFVQKHSASIHGSRHNGAALWRLEENKQTKGGIDRSLPGGIFFPTIHAHQFLMCVSVKVKTSVEGGRRINLRKDRPEICESKIVVLSIDKKSFKGKPKGLLSKIARFLVG